MSQELDEERLVILELRRAFAEQITLLRSHLARVPSKLGKGRHVLDLYEAGRVDPVWLAQAQEDLRRLGLEDERLQIRLSKINLRIKAEQPETLEQVFIRYAESMLPRDTFLSIANAANRDLGESRDENASNKRRTAKEALEETRIAILEQRLKIKEEINELKIQIESARILGAGDAEGTNPDSPSSLELALRTAGQENQKIESVLTGINQQIRAQRTWEQAFTAHAQNILTRDMYRTILTAAHNDLDTVRDAAVRRLIFVPLETPPKK
jgi:hypothetical protein